MTALMGSCREKRMGGGGYGMPRDFRILCELVRVYVPIGSMLSVTRHTAVTFLCGFY